MKIQIIDDKGVTVFESDTGSQFLPTLPTTAADKQAILNALHDASQFLAQDHHVIASIKADIQNAVSRIEVELGAHPAFTWAQTKLGNAVAHLEAYVAGKWSEPDQGVASRIIVDTRGVVLDVKDVIQ